MLMTRKLGNDERRSVSSGLKRDLAIAATACGLLLILLVIAGQVLAQSDRDLARDAYRAAQEWFESKTRE